MEMTSRYGPSLPLTVWDTQPSTMVIKQNLARTSPIDIPKMESAGFAAQCPSTLTPMTKYNFPESILYYPTI